MPINETLSLLTNELSTDAVRHNPRLRMWCLTLRGSSAIDNDSKIAKGDWTEALQLAQRLGETQWAARATGELGIPAFLEGNATSAISLLRKAIFSAYRTGDVASALRGLLTNGHGYPVWQGTFLSFGEEFNPEITDNHYKFTGKELDGETGLDYFGASYYSMAWAPVQTAKAI